VTQKLVWYTIRASGIVTWGLATASVLWGLLLSSRSTRRPRPAWVLDLHRFIAGLSFAFLTVHVGALLLDSYVGFSPTAITIPFASHWRPAAVAWGILACYLLVAIEITSLLVARLPRRLWHAIHLGSFVVFAAATVHGLTAGTDARNPVLRLFAIVSIAAVVELAVLRVVARARRRSRVGLPSARRPAVARTRRPVFETALVETQLSAPTLRPIEDAIAEVRRGAARGGRLARRGHDQGRLSRGARR
jgi:predicted ferric reductase